MSWRVRYIDYPLQFRKMEKEIMETIHSVLSKGDLMLRQQLRDFESHLAEYVGTRYAVGTSNCTDALKLSLIAAGVGQGDEVITVSHTFVATASAIHHIGAIPILVDIGQDHNMDVDLIEEAITSRTKAILPVHLNGRLCDMNRIMEISDKNDLFVIEDSAQALGGSLDGKGGGSIGLAGCFSFYPAKLLGAFGDAGAVTTNSQKMAEKITSLRDHGRKKDGDLSGWGFNCRLDNLQAALLDLKLKHFPSWVHRRRELAGLYQENLKDVRQLRLPVPPAKDGPFFDVFQNYEFEAEERDRLVSFLKKKGVETMLPWGGRGVHQFKALGLSHFNLPRTDAFFSGALMVPMNPDLSNEDVNYVSEVIKDFYHPR